MYNKKNILWRKLKMNEFGSSPLRSQRDYNEINATRKDVDMMRDTGGRYNKKKLQKPSRTDRKNHGLSQTDPDAKDTKRDKDLKLAKRILKIAKLLLENNE